MDEFQTTLQHWIWWKSMEIMNAAQNCCNIKGGQKEKSGWYQWYLNVPLGLVVMCDGLAVWESWHWEIDRLIELWCAHRLMACKRGAGEASLVNCQVSPKLIPAPSHLPQMLRTQARRQSTRLIAVCRWGRGSYLKEEWLQPHPSSMSSSTGNETGGSLAPLL